MERMSEQQKKVAAIELCRLRGIDPNERVGQGADPDSNGFIPAIQLYSYAWQRAIREIEAQELLDLAMKAGRKE